MSGVWTRYESHKKRIKIELVICFDSTCYVRFAIEFDVGEDRRHWCRSQNRIQHEWTMPKIFSSGLTMTNLRNQISSFTHFMWFQVRVKRICLEIFHSGEDDEMERKDENENSLKRGLEKWIGRRLMCLNFDFISPVYITYSDPIMQSSMFHHPSPRFILIKFKFLWLSLVRNARLSFMWREMLSCFWT